MAKAQTAAVEAAVWPAVQMARDRVLLIRAGRGNSGGTTALNAAIELALMGGRDPVVLDAARNPSLSALYPGKAIRPASHAIGDVKEAVTTRVLDTMLDEERSGVIDLGGGQDDTLVEYMLDLDLVSFGQAKGIRPVFVVTFGPSQDDFEHALEVKRRGLFDGAGVILVQNEGVLRRGQQPRDVFGSIQARPEFVEWVGGGARPLYLPTLACLEDVRRLKLPLRDAAANRPNDAGVRLGPAKAWTVERWLSGFARECEANDCAEWLP